MTSARPVLLKSFHCFCRVMNRRMNHGIMPSHYNWKLIATLAKGATLIPAFTQKTETRNWWPPSCKSGQRFKIEICHHQRERKRQATFGCQRRAQLIVLITSAGPSGIFWITASMWALLCQMPIMNSLDYSLRESTLGTIDQVQPQPGDYRSHWRLIG